MCASPESVRDRERERERKRGRDGEKERERWREREGEMERGRLYIARGKNAGRKYDAYLFLSLSLSHPLNEVGHPPVDRSLSNTAKNKKYK